MRVVMMVALAVLFLAGPVLATVLTVHRPGYSLRLEVSWWLGALVLLVLLLGFRRHEGVVAVTALVGFAVSTGLNLSWFLAQRRISPEDRRRPERRFRDESSRLPLHH